MKTSEIEKEIYFAEAHPFQVIYFEAGGNGWYLVSGDKLEKYPDKHLVITNISWQNEEEKEVVKASRLEDTKETYRDYTGTDGSKVNWEPLTYNEK